MPVDKKLFIRLKVLDNLLRQKSGVTYKYIKDIYRGEGYNVTVRTIQKDIEMLKDEYGAHIQCSHIGHQISIRYQDITQSAFAIVSTQTLIEETRKKLEKELFSPHFLISASILEHIAKGNPIQQFVDAVNFDYNVELDGLEFFPYLLRAIINQHCVSFEYKPFSKGNRRIKVSPYLLKYYNQRWFLICKTIGSPYYSINALDRIQGEIRVEEKIPYDIPDYNYINDCLNNTIGLTDAFNDRIPVEEILIKISDSYYPYLETKPFPNQESYFENGFHVIRFCVKINKELISRILSLGAEAEIIEPQHLRDYISIRINDMIKAYGNTTK